LTKKLAWKKIKQLLINLNNKLTMSEIAKLNEPLGTYCAVDVAIYNRQNQILLGERLVKAGFKMWGFPGGHLNPYEKISECAQREIREELGGGYEPKKLYHYLV